jgi:hypothetical protein
MITRIYFVRRKKLFFFRIRLKLFHNFPRYIYLFFARPRRSFFNLFTLYFY